MAPVASGAIANQDDKVPDTAKAHIKKADEAYASRKFDLAKDEAKNALKLEKNLPEAYLILALVYREQGSQKEAIKNAEAAISYRQNYAFAHYLLGLLLYEIGDIKKSTEETDLAISQGLPYASAYVLKGALYLVDVKFEAALQSYKKAREMADPNDPVLPSLKEQISAMEKYVEARSQQKDPSYKRPQMLNLPLPNYTQEARQRRVQGKVIAIIQLSEQGDIKSVILVSRLGYGLDEEALIAARQVKFSPATKDGHPIPYWLAMQIEFNLK